MVVSWEMTNVFFLTIKMYYFLTSNFCFEFLLILKVIATDQQFGPPFYRDLRLHIRFPNPKRNKTRMLRSVPQRFRVQSIQKATDILENQKAIANSQSATQLLWNGNTERRWCNWVVLLYGDDGHLPAVRRYVKNTEPCSVARASPHFSRTHYRASHAHAHFPPSSANAD